MNVTLGICADRTASTPSSPYHMLHYITYMRIALSDMTYIRTDVVLHRLFYKNKTRLSSDYGQTESGNLIYFLWYIVSRQNCQTMPFIFARMHVNFIIPLQQSVKFLFPKFSVQFIRYFCRNAFTRSRCLDTVRKDKLLTRWQRQPRWI